MVLLRSSSGAPAPTYRETDSLLDSSSEFLSLQSPSRRRLRSSDRLRSENQCNGTRRDSDGPFSEDDDHSARPLRKTKPENGQNYSDSSMEKKNTHENNTEGKIFTRRLARLQADTSLDGVCKQDELVADGKQLQRTRNAEKTSGCEENGDVEVRRSGRIRRSLYSTTNQSVLFDKLITNTAEAVLQKMDDMKKMRRRRMRELDDLGVYNDTEEENTDMYSRVKRKRGVQRLEEETTDNQEESEESSEEGEGQDDDDDEDDGDDDDGEEDNQKRYELRQRKAVVPYQAPLAEPRHHKKQGMFYTNTSSPVRRRYRFGSGGPRSPYCNRRLTRRRHAIHSSDSTSSSSSSDDEEHFERRLSRSRKRAISRCLPFNMARDDLKGIHKDRMKIGASLADVDPMQIDKSVRFSNVGGLSKHIDALKEMVVFPLLYPEIFDRFKIQPPRGCLFYGPPGTGKTLVARALANECSVGDRRVAFFMRKGADCLSKWVGESERQLRLLFDQAYQMRPSIIFFDEIDGLAPVRSSRQDQIHSSIVSTLLALMDGLDSRGEIVVIGATNRLDSIDPALRRPGRFDREFLFGLPDRDARMEILKIHTNEWNPKPSDVFLEELAEMCVGYCGADLKSVCAEAALCAVRRRYPQIYTTSDKLQLDVSSIKITAGDFAAAIKRTVPASQRAVVSPGQALSPISQLLLQSTLQNILEVLKKVFPHADEVLKKKRKDSELSSQLPDDLLDGDDGPSVFAAELPQRQASKQKHPFLHFNIDAHRQPTSFRPRLLIAGKPGLGQGSHLAPAVIHALEKFTVYSLDLAVLLGSSITSPEESCAQVFREAKRTPPSIVYVPHIHLWWETVSYTLKATFISLLHNIPSFSPILLLATCDMDYCDLPQEIQHLFVEDYGEVFQVQPPRKNERKAFFSDLILNQPTKPPVSKKKAMLRTLEVLPLAPPPEPRALTPEELKRLEEQEEDHFRELRLFLRDVTNRLAIDKRFRAFTKPVDPEEVPDYATVIEQPMDLSTVISKIDLHKYQTVKEYLKDIDLICSNALEYNPDKDPGDRLIRHRACALKDTTYAIIKKELDEEFEKQCEEIQESRNKRGFSASKYAPSYYHVLRKQKNLQNGEKGEADPSGKESMSGVPLAVSTPTTVKTKKKCKRKSRWSSGIFAKKRFSPCLNNDEAELNEDSSMDADDDNHVPGDPMSSPVSAAKDNVTPTDNVRTSEPMVSGETTKQSEENKDTQESEDLCIVDKQKLQELLTKIVKITKGNNVSQLEKLYSSICQCLYRHREDYDKTLLLKEMEEEIEKISNI
ncbi:ATPase family AAA domain-containing protein 2 [Spea bombifrons]|uniref:ATPase family AAA domain-containing protein 2 n=1 Tax=Spea bombifrons TaxID=233779 RepID=UPI002349646B|nr:ATPase family AAA domain-containing protein 2 [Spea bombifrons]